MRERVTSNDYKANNEELFKTNFVESSNQTMEKTKADAWERTQFQKAMIKMKEEEIDKSSKIRCKQCGTKEKKYFHISIVTPTLDKKDARFKCKCTNCGFGNKKNRSTGKMEIWDITAKQ